MTNCPTEATLTNRAAEIAAAPHAFASADITGVINDLLADRAAREADWDAQDAAWSDRVAALAKGDAQ